MDTFDTAQKKTFRILKTTQSYPQRLPVMFFRSLKVLAMILFIPATQVFAQSQDTAFWTVDSQSLTESDAMLTLTLELGSTASGEDVVVPFSFSGSATRGEDFTYTGPMFLTVPDGSNEVDLELTLNDDSAAEGEETIVVTLGEPPSSSWFVGAPSTHTITIAEDDEPYASFSVSTQTVDEGDTEVTVTIEMDGVTVSSTDVSFSISGDATGGGTDYSADSSPVTIPAGTDESISFTVTIAEDAQDEPDEEIILTLEDGGDGYNYAVGSTDEQTITITDDDEPTVAFSTASATNSESVTSVVVTAEISDISYFNVTVPFSISGTATQVASGGKAQDFSVAAEEIIIEAGESSGTVTFTIVNDALDEPDEETISLSMGSVSGGDASSSGQTDFLITIQDDDDPPEVGFTTSGQSPDESDGSVDVIISLSSVSGRDVTVPFSLSGTADADGVDYAANVTSVLIVEGSTTAGVNVTIEDDDIDEEDQTAILTIGSPTNATVGSTDDHTITIEDNDAPTVDFTSESQSDAEDAGTFTLTAELAGGTSDWDITIPLSYGGSDAIQDTDFSVLPTSILIEAGSTTNSTTITVVDDLIDEFDEDIVITMGTPTGGDVSSSGTLVHTATIEDNDLPPLVSFSESGQDQDEDAGSFDVVFELDTVSGLDVTIPFTVNGTALASAVDYDFEPTSEVVIEAGSINTTVTVTITDDDIDEEDSESIHFWMDGVPDYGRRGATTDHEISLLDNDLPPLVELAIDGDLSEPSPGKSGSATTSDITVSLLSPVTKSGQPGQLSGLDVTVHLAFAGDAIGLGLGAGKRVDCDGCDYTYTDDDGDGEDDAVSIVIPAGSNSASLTLSAVDDDLFEGGDRFTVEDGQEDVQISIDSVENGTEDGDQAVAIRITDEEDEPSVVLTASPWVDDESVMSEAEGSTTFTVTSSNTSEFDLTVVLTCTENDPEVPGSGAVCPEEFIDESWFEKTDPDLSDPDFSVDSSNSILIEALSTGDDLSGSVSITAIDDTMLEEDETFAVAISSATMETAGDVETYTESALDIRIADNEAGSAPLVEVFLLNGLDELTEDGDSVAEIYARLLDADGDPTVSNFDVVVSLVIDEASTADGASSTDGSPDFVYSTLNLTISAGATNTTSGITISAFNEEQPENEGDEAIILNIDAIDGADEWGGSDSQQLEILLVDDDLPPVANDQEVETLEDTALLAHLLDVSDENDDLLVAALTNGPSHGTVELFQSPGNGESVPTFNYTPAVNYRGEDSFEYELSDGHGANVTANVTITVTPLNTKPDAKLDAAVTDEEVPVVIDVLANDSDQDGDALTIASVSQGDNGSDDGVATDNGDGTITFVPAQDFNGLAHFEYTITDGKETDTDPVTVTVNPVNDAPTAVDDAATTSEDTPVSVDIIGNDTDPDDASLSIASLGSPMHGAVADNGDGSVTYTPATDYVGEDSFTYSVTDGDLSSEGTVTVTVEDVNDPPVAYDDARATTAGGTVWLHPLSNDQDPEGDILSVTLISSPTSGTLTDNGDGTFDYTAAVGFAGTVELTYTVSDGTATDEGVIVITVTDPGTDGDGVSDETEDGAPNNGDGNNDGTPDSEQPNVSSLPVAEGESQGEYITVEASDTGTLGTVISGSNPSPADTPTGTTFPVGFLSYRVQLEESQVTSKIVIYLPAGKTASSYLKYGPTEDNPTPHWYDFAYDAVTETGAIIDNENGRITLHFVDGLRGDDDLEVNGIIDDPGAPVLTENSAPTAVQDAYSTAEDVALTFNPLTNDLDDDGDALTLVSIGQPSAGSLTDNGDGTFTLTPPVQFSGTITIAYSIQDTEGATSAGTITVTVNSTNDDPIAVNDEGATAEETPLTLDVLPNDSDPDGDDLSIQTVSVPENGTANITEEGTIVYTPNEEFSGTDTFTYTVSDGQGGTATATVMVTVSGTNDAPVAVADDVSVAEDGSVQISVLTNDSDAEGTVSISSFEAPSHGAITDNGDGTLTYVPAADFNGSDSFTYTIIDEEGATAEAAVTITVTAVNDAPVATDDSITTAEDTAVLIDVLSNDSDVEGDVSLVSTSDPSHGTALVNPDGSIEYTPAADYVGQDSFTYTITDSDGAMAQATVTVAVGASNDSPVFSAGNLTFPSFDMLWLGADPESDPAEPGASIDVNIPPASDADGDVITYSVELSLTDSFVESIATFQTTETAFSIQVEELLVLLDPAGLAPGTQLTVWFRVTAKDPFGAENALDAVSVTFARGSFVSNESEELPTSVFLSPNYPNPFNPQTTVEFGLPNAMDVQLIVYDLTGRPVQRVVDGTLSAGVHRVRIEMADVPSGAYLYRLVTPEQIITHVMHVIK